ncbi:hypothetical protein SAMN05428953_12682 [Mesorhizobium muleiense]|uniref:Uncharacterized protein n=1 Tax=Mesorhizobium muleiense TaxID=1004279 RepID=A0A1G9H7T4_9HYPH|nr:hypothetical protein [Mesorhizobium muleiense]SDL08463.1 hypothetical protein SAMN05428953_12682 [Mesorhizobium muleiense]
MIHLLFNADAIPRTTTREQWREIDRWRRVTERTLRAERERQIASIITYGTSHPEIVRDFIEKAINPPIMMYPKPKAFQSDRDIRITPGSVWMVE